MHRKAPIVQAANGTNYGEIVNDGKEIIRLLTMIWKQNHDVSIITDQWWIQLTESLMIDY